MKSNYELDAERNEGLYDAAHEYQMEHYLAETDKAVVDQLTERYGDLIPQERMEAVKQNNSIFIQDREVFDNVYAYETGERPEPGTKVLGYSLGANEGPRIAADYIEVPRVIEHERLHQLSAPGIEKELGRRLDEGITEDLAIENLGVEPMEGYPQSYPEERQAAHELRDLCGDSAVEKAYFQGDTQELRRCLDAALGPNGLEQFRRKLGDATEPMEMNR